MSDFVIENGILKSYIGNSEDVIIPEGVTVIESEAFSKKASGIFSMFRKKASIRSVSIPNTVTTIQAGAFKGCNELRKIAIPDSIKYIGDQAFYGCDGLADEQGLIIIRSVLHYCKKEAKYIDIPDNVVQIGSSAFAECKKILGVSIPSSVTSIGKNAFDGHGCNNLILYVSSGSFAEVYARENKLLYYVCPDVPAVSSSNSCFTFDRQWNGDRILTHCDRDVENAIIPQGTVSIMDSAFIECKKMTMVRIPNSVTSIGKFAFAYCTALKSIQIPDSVSFINEAAFSDCLNITSVTIPSSVTKMGSFVFNKCKSLTNVLLSEGVAIGDYTFKECTKLNNLLIGNNVTIGRYAFADCSGLKSLVVPEGTSLGDYAFQSCAQLSNVIFDDNVIIGQGTFSECNSLTSITLPLSTSFNGTMAFYNCPNLTLNVYQNSAAKRYAKNNLLPYSVIENGEDFFRATAVRLVYDNSVSIWSYLLSHFESQIIEQHETCLKQIMMAYCYVVLELFEMNGDYAKVDSFIKELDLFFGDLSNSAHDSWEDNNSMYKQLISENETKVNSMMTLIYSAVLYACINDDEVCEDKELADYIEDSLNKLSIACAVIQKQM